MTADLENAAMLDVVVDDNWQVLRELGSGGMGKVYLARDLTLGRQVALKLLTVDGAEQRDRMGREAKVLAKLDHPNVVPVYAFGSWEGRTYLVMKLVEGRTLRQVIDDPSFTAARALTLLRQLGDGLDHVHERGLLHRDVKPANVIVTADDHPTLVDFGISREVAPVGDEITREGYILATLPFASPEALTRPASIDHRSDLYSFGIICYRALVRSAPFEATGDYEMLQKKLSCQFESVTQRGLPAELDDVFRHVFSPTPDGRPSSCRELVDALDAAMVDVALPAPKPSNSSSGRPVTSSRSSRVVPPTGLTRQRALLRRQPLAVILGVLVFLVASVATALVLWPAKKVVREIDAGVAALPPPVDAGAVVVVPVPVPVELPDAGPEEVVEVRRPDAGRPAVPVRPVDRSAEVRVVVTVQGEQAWGEVKVDGEYQPMAPCVVRLSAGSHRVTVSHPGFESQTRSVKVNGRDQLLRFEFR